MGSLHLNLAMWNHSQERERLKIRWLCYYIEETRESHFETNFPLQFAPEDQWKVKTVTCNCPIRVVIDLLWRHDVLTYISGQSGGKPNNHVMQGFMNQKMELQEYDGHPPILQLDHLEILPHVGTWCHTCLQIIFRQNLLSTIATWEGSQKGSLMVSFASKCDQTTISDRVRSVADLCANHRFHPHYIMACDRISGCTIYDFVADLIFRPLVVNTPSCRTFGSWYLRHFLWQFQMAGEDVIDPPDPLGWCKREQVNRGGPALIAYLVV